MLLLTKCLETKKYHHPRKTLLFELLSLDGQILKKTKKIKINHDNIPFRESDCVLSKCKKIENEYVFIKAPMITTSNDSKDIIKTISELLPKGFSHRATRINQLSEDLNFLDKLCFEYKGELNAILNTQLIYQFLGKWKTHSVIRKLLLRGLDYRIIYRSDILGSYENYSNFLECPYTCPLITAEEAAEMMLQQYQEPSDSDIYCGNVLRKVYHSCRKRGWTCFPISEMKKLFPGYTEYNRRLVNKFNLVFDYDSIYYRPQYDGEVFIAKYLKSKKLSIESKNYSFKKVLEKSDLKLSLDQQEVLKKSLSEDFTVITGPAGTGKTTIIKEFIRHLRFKNNTWVLCAPTGKAAHRLHHATQEPTFTLHRLIMMIGKKQNSIPNRIDYLIIDESSMVNNILFKNLLEAIGRMQLLKPRIFLFGDVNQLPPIEAGSLLKQVVKSNSFPVYNLTTNHRNLKGGLIVENSQKMLTFDKKKDGKFVYTEGPDFTIDIARERTFRKFLKTIDFSHDVVVITPYNKVMVSLNKYIQELTKKDEEKEVIDYQGNIWRVGNKVIMNKNNYEFNVMNGESGVIKSIDERSVTVDFYQSGVHSFSLSKRKKQWSSQNKKSWWFAGEQYADDQDKERDDENKKDLLSTDVLSLSYCLTIHKSQGSEWNHVIIYIPLGSSAGNFLTRELLYTAVTRGREKVTVMGDDMVICSSVEKKSKPRVEWLFQRLR